MSGKMKCPKCGCNMIEKSPTVIYATNPPCRDKIMWCACGHTENLGVVARLESMLSEWKQANPGKTPTIWQTMKQAIYHYCLLVDEGPGKLRYVSGCSASLENLGDVNGYRSFLDFLCKTNSVDKEKMVVISLNELPSAVYPQKSQMKSNKVQKWRKRPVVIEAIQLNFDSWGAVCGFVTGDSFGGGCYVDENGKATEFHSPIIGLKIVTLEGTMLAVAGDWIIKGVNGEFYPCKPNIFDKTYELVDGQE